MAKGDPKLKPEQHRNLVERYNIHFDGPILPSSWPDQYVNIFGNFREIKCLRYEEYKPNERRGVRAVAEMKDRVARLNRIAHSCRKQRENEPTWRGLTEPEIVSRFIAEVACRICRKRLWDSEFKALRDDPTKASNLRDRPICSCSLEARAMEDIDERGGAELFLSRFQTRFVHDPADGLAERGLRPQEPDRVFGLRDTRAFKAYASARQGLRQSPFSDGKVLYPFLIIEAKSEKGSCGFESIEAQTAFPIRTLLKLQNDLGSASESGLKPLVWFLANQGEDWRVYGSILDGSKWRVINLWHGSLLSRDETLQLLLIVDYICYWARDIYRRDIIRCLKIGDVDMRDTTPAYTIISSQSDELNSVPQSPSLPTHRAYRPGEPSITDLTPDADREDTDMDMEDMFAIGDDDDDAGLSSSDSNEEDDTSLTSTDPDDQQALMRFSLSHSPPKPWSRHATIRHSNMVLFAFRHFAVPENGEALAAWLNSFRATGGSTKLTQTLFRLIERSNAVTITMNGILQLENLWTRTTHQPSPKNDEPILAWIWFHSYLRPGDWQVVRELRCFTISQSAIMNLVTIAGVPRSLSPDDWIAHRCHCLTTDAQSLRSFCGRDSMISAALVLGLRLESFVHANDEVHFRWVKNAEDTVDAVAAAGLRLWSLANPEAVVPASISTFRSRDLLEELLPGNLVPPFLGPHLRMKTGFGKKGAVLVKKTSFQPATCPSYCFMVFDETDFHDEPCLGQKIIQVTSIGDTYVLQLNGTIGRDASPSESDKSAMKLWADILCGKTLADAEWPS